MTNDELGKAVEGIREKLADMGERLIVIEGDVRSLMEDRMERRTTRRQMMLAVWGAGAAQAIMLITLLLREV